MYKIGSTVKFVISGDVHVGTITKYHQDSGSYDIQKLDDTGLFAMSYKNIPENTIIEVNK